MFDAVDSNSIGTGIFDLPAHRVYKIGEIYHFRLARGILDNGSAVAS